MEKQILSEAQIKVRYIETLVMNGYDISDIYPKSKIKNIEKLVLGGYDISDTISEKATFPDFSKMLVFINELGQWKGEIEFVYQIQFPNFQETPAKKTANLHSKFYDYLLAHDLFRMTICSDSHSLYAVLHQNDKPLKENFSQIENGQDGELIVRLSIAEFLEIVAI